MSDERFRLYDADECGKDGYPLAWHGKTGGPALKDLVREEADNRCLRCGHPYEKGMGEWSPCDERCDHGGPIRVTYGDYFEEPEIADNPLCWIGGENVDLVEARWRVLTVHHLDGVKTNCFWWNLVPLCQRDHLIIQRRVVMERPWPWPHSDWFKPYAAAFYAFKYHGQNIDRAAAELAQDELLAMGMARAREEAPWQDRLEV